MKRIFGMMHKSEISTEKHYKDKFDLTITIQAGEHGWTVIYADSGAEYNDVDDTPENNFKKAYDVATKHLGKLTEVCNNCNLCCCKCEKEI